MSFYLFYELTHDPHALPVLTHSFPTRRSADLTGRIYPTNVACRLLDLSTARYGDYKHRRRHVPDCLTLTKAKVDDLEWLPQTCAYRLRAESQPLPDRSEEHTSELQSLMRISYAVFCLKKQTRRKHDTTQ